MGIFYADEVEEVRECPGRLQLKPAINPALLLADDYIGSPVLIRLPVFKQLNGFRAEARTAIVYDLLLRALNAGIIIERIPVVMVAHEGRRARPVLVDRLGAVRNWVSDSGHALEVTAGLTEASLQVSRRFTAFPEVTLVIPTRQALQLHAQDAGFGRPHILNLLDSIVRTDWPMHCIRVLIGDDLPDDSIYARREYPFGVRRIETVRAPEVPFNYAAKMNLLWRRADTELMVLMNDDIVVRDAGWLRALMTFAMDEDVGGVGARLLFGDGRIQHAGMPGGLGGACAHAWIFQPAGDKTYNDWALVHREWSMVTGAVFATRRRVLELLNGFDEHFGLEFNDADLCLRMRLLGLKIIYTPFAELLHYEKASRGDDLPAGNQVAMFVKRWGEFVKNDPAFHPGFDMTNACITPMPVADAWYRI